MENYDVVILEAASVIEGSRDALIDGRLGKLVVPLNHVSFIREILVLFIEEVF